MASLRAGTSTPDFAVLPKPPLPGRLPELRQQLLAWWHDNGRHTIPWKRLADGRLPGPGEPLDPYPIWIAEANRG